MPSLHGAPAKAGGVPRNMLAHAQAVKAINDAAYKVLRQFLVGPGRKNEAYLGRYLPFLKSLIATDQQVR